MAYISTSRCCLRVLQEHRYTNMEKHIIKFKKDIFAGLKEYLLSCPDNNEKHAFLYCNIARKDDTIIFYPARIIGFKEDDPNVSFSVSHFSLKKELLHRIHIDFVESSYDGLISCHSHAFETGEVWFSGTDDQNDMNLMTHFYSELTSSRKNLGRSGKIETLSMVFGQHTIGARGFIQADKTFTPVDKIIVMDKTINTIIPTNRPRPKKECLLERQRLDRQVLAFGEAGREQLKNIRVGIIGGGGTGSIIAEGICRLGVKDIVLVDADRIELSNLNRWQGGTMADIDRLKVNVLAERLVHMAPDVQVTPLAESVLSEEAVTTLKDCDCILGCIDAHHVRYFLNRFSMQFLIPFLDCSTGIIMKDGNIGKIGSRIAAVIPSVTRCLDCSEVEYYKPEDIHHHFTDGATYNNLKRNKYIQEEVTSIHAPAVYPVNMLTSSILLMEFMNLFWGFKPVFWNTYLDYMTFSEDCHHSCDLTDNPESPLESCLFCNEYLAAGDSESLDYFLRSGKKIDMPEYDFEYTPPAEKAGKEDVEEVV